MKLFIDESIIRVAQIPTPMLIGSGSTGFSQPAINTELAPR